MCSATAVVPLVFSATTVEAPRFFLLVSSSSLLERCLPTPTCAFRLRRTVKKAHITEPFGAEKGPISDKNKGENAAC